ncbi:MFS transporter [Phyllobacterium sp. OV277]|uniref:MFS transporter n=1 Tax=Phyllobacterium sp. OV277 TaxID=1882772 RepID=UPI00088BE3C5|nr:MFS transporter [Phyllobacterium sp. OV277]SDP83775.1 Major Facilitator Superfamily protein [Phyllobacterium sp. OV277]
MTDLSQPERQLKRDGWLSQFLPEDRTVRVLAIAQTMGAVAAGLYFSSSALFFSRSSGLAPLEIGLGLTISGVVGLLVPLPFGILADRWSARNIAGWLTVGVGLSYWFFLLVNGFTAFVIATCCFAACMRGAMTARMTMIASLIDSSQRTQTSAYLRALGNGGMSVGAMIGGLALYFDSLTAHRLAFAVGGAIFLVAALVYRSLPAKAPELAPIRPGPTLAVLRDRTYLALMLLNTVILLYIPLLNMALPLWIALHTKAPLWISSLLFWVNAVCVMLLQVRLGRRVATAKDARRSIFSATLLLSAACLAFAAMALSSTVWLAVLLAIFGALLHVFGEMMHMAGAWDLSFRLAPPGRQGEYQGFFNTSSATAEMLGPFLLTALLVSWGAPGWLVLALVFPAAGFAIIALFGRQAYLERDLSG